MKLGIAIFPLLVLAAAAAEEANSYKVPAIPDGEARKLKVRYEDPRFNDAYFANKPMNQRVLHEEAASMIDTVARFRGEGNNRQLIYTRNEVLHNHGLSTWVFTFAPADKLVMHTIEHTVKTPAGKQVRHEFFDLTDPIFHYPPDTFHPYVLEIFYRTLPLKVGYRNQCHLWLAPRSIMRVMISVEKVETMKTPAGEIECYCVQMTPSMEDFLGKAGRMVQPLVPKFTFWMAVKGTHPLVVYRGPLGEVNLGSAPIEIHELMSISPPL